jgi:hypothetical protein
MCSLKSIGGSLLILLFLKSCSIKQAYFFCAFNGTTPTCHTIPLQSHSIKDALYGRILIGGGGANDRLIDEIFIFRPSIYQSQSRENCQFFAEQI